MLKQYVLNLGLLLNYATMTLIGQDPRKTISAFMHLKGYTLGVRVLNTLYRNPHHCEQAAQGWDSPAITDRSLW